MANGDHLALLKQGVETWNRWREQHLAVRPDVSRADLSMVNLSRADLTEADLTGAHIGFGIFGGVDLSHVHGLDSVEHEGPSSIGIDTDYRSGGKIPEMFLRGAGVPNNFITFARSLVATPMQFYSCFISYSHADKSFARRLLVAPLGALATLGLGKRSGPRQLAGRRDGGSVPSRAA
jgi:hypothetical protein